MSHRDRFPGGRSGLVAVVALLTGLASLAMAAATQHWRAQQGHALFTGESSGASPPLHGHLAGHDSRLPPGATLCVNCHVTTAAAGPSGTPLHRATLDAAIRRRGGPPSTYDETSLCRLLRDGIDPAYVVVDQTMPRFEATDAQCAALWTWLNR